MGYVLVTDTELEDIGDAIRAKTGGNSNLTLAQMADEIAGIETVGTYEYIEPEYYGLSYGYIAYGSSKFYSNPTNTACVNIYEVEANTLYVFFAGNNISDRLRAHFYSGKSYSDFDDYVKNSYANAEIYTASDNITGSSSDLSGDRLKERIFYTPSSNGVLFVTTSNSSVLNPVLLFKVNL